MGYVDGYLIAVPTGKRAEYEALARDAAAVFKEHGALEVVECWGEDVPEGKLTSFPLAVKLEPGETVVFSWVLYPSRAARDAANVKVMEDPRMKAIDPASMPFDAKRMIFGGFDVLVRA
ncbi:DUF1428 domain-containing protein [uncultured Amaricoccus sp.]|uniref:DUF1428 domain-containing protein n=1 Tax=uncultured Amaricoccus sp. TaxID=339341 RepID=UPI00345A8F45